MVRKKKSVAARIGKAVDNPVTQATGRGLDKAYRNTIGKAVLPLAAHINQRNAKTAIRTANPMPVRPGSRVERRGY